MKVQLLGAAQAVTGSCYIIQSNSKRFAVDCGLHQGSSGLERRNINPEGYQAGKIDFILLTHAHIDHSGLLPRLVKEGFNGPVYCTKASKALLEIMLLDSAHIQEMEAEWASRKRMRQGEKPVPALYTTEDATQSLKLLHAVSYNTPFSPCPDVQVTYRDAGHILGSAFIELSVQEENGLIKTVFSGDLGRPNSLLVNDPSLPLLNPDYLFLESTYGDRDHKNELTSRQELADAIAFSSAHGQKTIIPAFAVERTQEIIFTLYLLQKEGKLPPDIPIYVDSPLAVKATKIFQEHPEFLDIEAAKLISAGENPFKLPNIHYIVDVKDSQAINQHKGPGIIISASGMCNAGRIQHHLRHNIFKEGASVVFTGYQAVGTPGRKLVDGAKQINLLGELLYVKAKIFTIGGFSGHAGQSQILDWVGKFVHPALNIFLVHGENKAQQILAKLLLERFSINADIPAYLEVLELAPGRSITVHEAPKTLQATVNWDLLTEVTGQNLHRLIEALPKLKEKQWPEQTDLREQLLEINKQLIYFLSQT